MFFDGVMIQEAPLYNLARDPVSYFRACAVHLPYLRQIFSLAPDF